MTETAPLPGVLVVDDTRLDREIARDAIGTGARVVCCGSAGEALEWLGRERFELVLSDLTMPGASGLELLERMRRDHSETDFILITAQPSIDSAVQALRMGAVDYLRKPVRAEELSLLVQRTLERRRIQAENLHLRDLLATVEDCRALSGSLEPTEIHAVALDILMLRLGRERGLAVFRRGDKLGTQDVAFRGYDEAASTRLRAGLVGEKPIELADLAHAELASDGSLHRVLREAGLCEDRLLVVPVHGREDEGGVLAVAEGAEPFTTRQLEIARLVATHAQVAVQNAERYHQAQERAFIDDVTGVYNARYLFAALNHELRRAQRYGSALSLVFIDVDRFKLVNDNHGHLVGSRTLHRIAEVLGSCIRQVDTLARYGGDEFTILLADTGLEEGVLIGERIRASVAESLFESRGPEPLSITVSVGVSAFPVHGDQPEALLDLADKAMYRAKSLGRNRVSNASDL